MNRIGKYEYKKLGEVCRISAGQGAPQGDNNYSPIGTPFIKAGNLEDLINGQDEYKIQKVNDEVAKSHRLKLCKAGSVVFAKSGMSCMKGHVYTLKHDCYVVSHLAIICPISLISSYLNYTLKYYKPNSLIKDSAYPSISLDDISNFYIPVPSIENQEHIVAELDLLQGIIDKQKAQLKEYDTLAQSIFYNMFGDPVENGKGWSVKSLGDICADKKEIKRASKCFESFEDIFYIDISSINSHTNSLIGITPYVFDEAPSRAQQKVEKGDVLISLVRPNLKNIALVDLEENNLVASSGFCVLRASKPSNVFIKYLVLTPHFTEYLVKRVSGANYPAVREDDIKNCIIGVPPLQLQQQFAERIEAIEKQKAAINKSLEETQKLFDFTMDKYFG